MSLQTILLTSITIATVAWAMAFDAQAQTRVPTPAQSIAVTLDAR